MRRPAHSNALGTNAVATIRADDKKPLSASRGFNLLLVIGTVLDLIGQGEDIYLTIGTTRNKSALTLTVKWNGEPMSIYAETFDQLDIKCVGLLDDDA